jgi:uncharacterized membrane protein YfcA
MTILAYFALGALAGLLGGAFGIGGGVVMVPALLVIFKQPIYIAIGTSMMVVVPIAISGALRHYSLNNVNMQIALLAGLGGIIGAIIGASIVVKIPAFYVKRAFALFLIYSAIRLWFSK